MYCTSNGTQGTANICWWHGRCYCNMMTESIFTSTVSDYVRELLKPPKNWRWFDVYRVQARPVVVARVVAVARWLTRRQQPGNLAERRRMKRRKFLQKVRA